jgi:hypothetical protein
MALFAAGDLAIRESVHQSADTSAGNLKLLLVACAMERLVSA